jgi:hypothetical protein
MNPEQPPPDGELVVCHGAFLAYALGGRWYAEAHECFPVTWSRDPELIADMRPEPRYALTEAGREMLKETAG